MICWLPLLGALALADTPVETRFVQVFPPALESPAERTAGRPRAVVLIQGFLLHALGDAGAERAEFHSWQKADSTLVRKLAPDTDVYAYAYSQNATLEEIAAAPDLIDQVKRLKKLGYEEIVLVGHSAGGLLARQLVEDHPELGVTKVIQVGAPNGGSSWGKASWLLRGNQAAFSESLTKEACQTRQALRADKKLPEHVQCVCIVTNGCGAGDGAVLCRCQWTEDLQCQGVPAVAVSATHYTSVRGAAGTDKIAEFVRGKISRWDPSQVAAGRRHILGQR